MTSADERLAQLRSAFDDTFAEAPRGRADTEDFLAVRVGGEPAALRLADVARLARAPRIVAVPTRRSSVVGVASVRGALVAVHSLAILLGRQPRAHDWIVLVGNAGLAFAFDALEALTRAPRGTSTVLRTDRGAIPIIDLRAFVSTLQGV